MHVPLNSDFTHMIEDVTGFGDLAESGCFTDLSIGLAGAVLSEVGRFAAEGLAPSQVQQTEGTQETATSRAKQIVP